MPEWLAPAMSAWLTEAITIFGLGPLFAAMIFSLRDKVKASMICLSVSLLMYLSVREWLMAVIMLTLIGALLWFRYLDLRLARKRAEVRHSSGDDLPY